MSFRFILISFLFTCVLNAQDSLYTRKVIRYLCSEKCQGRGYVAKGLQHAEKFIVSELKANHLLPLFGTSYTQAFQHPVNTFPGKMTLKVNGKVLKAGVDYIVDNRSPSGSGNVSLSNSDNGWFQSHAVGQQKVQLVFKKKLTFSVSGTPSNVISFEIDSTRFSEIPKQISYEVEAKFIPDFESKNIGAYIEGKQNDTMMVFTAHYDHLGKMGKSTYFPGANDNASGVSVLLNLIQYYKQHPPKYKTVFVFFAGEEAGLLGSKYFVNNRSLNLRTVKFLINLDLLGTGDEGIMVVNGSVYTEAFDKLTAINTRLNALPAVKKRGKASNSDHYWFTEAGVPSFFIYTMGGIKAYHDVFDIEKTLPLTKYKEVFQLLTQFTDEL